MAADSPLGSFVPLDVFVPVGDGMLIGRPSNPSSASCLNNNVHQKMNKETRTRTIEDISKIAFDVIVDS